MDIFKVIYKLIVFLIKSPVHKRLLKIFYFIAEKFFIFVTLPVSLLIMKKAFIYSFKKIAPKMLKKYFKTTFPKFIKHRLERTYPFSLILKVVHIW